MNYNYIVQDLHFRNIAKFSKGCKEMRKLQNLRQPTIKGNEWQRTNAERQKLSKETAKTSKRTNQKKTKSLTFTTTSNAPLAPLHRLHKTQFNTISTETVATETVKQQANFTTSKQSYTKPAPLAINTPHAPLPPLHNLQKTQCNAISTETVAAETVK